MAQLSREAQNVNWLVSSFVRRVPGIAHAIVVTSDGLLMAVSERLDRARADQLAAVASGLASLTQGATRCCEPFRERWPPQYWQSTVRDTYRRQSSLMRWSSTPSRKAVRHAAVKVRSSSGTCARIAWLSGRGVPLRRAYSMISTSSGSLRLAGST